VQFCSYVSILDPKRKLSVVFRYTLRINQGRVRTYWIHGSTHPLRHPVRSRVRLPAPQMPCNLHQRFSVPAELNIYFTVTEYLHSCINIPIELLPLIIFSFKIRVSVHLFISQLLLFTGNSAHQLNTSAF